MKKKESPHQQFEKEGKLLPFSKENITKAAYRRSLHFGARYCQKQPKRLVLGFDKVIILKQDSVEEFSNIAGLQYIPFSGDNIEQTFYELQRKLKKTGLLK